MWVCAVPYAPPAAWPGPYLAYLALFRLALARRQLFGIPTKSPPIRAVTYYSHPSNFPGTLVQGSPPCAPFANSYFFHFWKFMSSILLGNYSYLGHPQLVVNYFWKLITQFRLNFIQTYPYRSRRLELIDLSMAFPLFFLFWVIYVLSY